MIDGLALQDHSRSSPSNTYNWDHHFRPLGRRSIVYRPRRPASGTGADSRRAAMAVHRPPASDASE